ncbi:hypothetical protein G8C92_25855 [Paenibacillus donghaensis]|uniref:hypothetical protein n=1 Tax=Paenibacillus donghaensis TaxID=414771 RepID=UPI0018834C05|nr:hypothetical protein [Paenibacillus donghaensis]MBE9917443.1 hypothetical protein [Paenibacillus donghaensis]
MNIKSLAVGALVGVSMIFGSVNVSASPVNTDSVSPLANTNQKLNLRIGDRYDFHGTVTIISNPQRAILIEQGRIVKGIQPGKATVSVNSNGTYIYYDIWVD